MNTFPRSVKHLFSTVVFVLFLFEWELGSHKVTSIAKIFPNFYVNSCDFLLFFYSTPENNENLYL